MMWPVRLFVVSPMLVIYFFHEIHHGANQVDLRASRRRVPVGPFGPARDVEAVARPSDASPAHGRRINAVAAAFERPWKTFLPAIERKRRYASARRRVVQAAVRSRNRAAGLPGASCRQSLMGGRWRGGDLLTVAG